MLSKVTIDTAIEALEQVRNTLSDTYPDYMPQYNKYMAHYDAALTELRQLPAMEVVPDGLYCDGALAIAYGGKDIGIRVDNQDWDGDDWVNNYEWLADGIGEGLPEGWQLWRPTTTQP